MPLNEGNAGVTCKIVDIAPKEEGMKKLLSFLGCYIGEEITIISNLVSNLIVYIKGSRYSIDSRLAKAIYVSLDW